MSNVEIVGIVVVGLTILFGLVIQMINLISKFTEPIKKTFTEFTQAIQSLTVAVERLLLGQEQLTNEIKFHHGRLTELEKKAHEIQLNCARNNQK